MKSIIRTLLVKYSMSGKHTRSHTFSRIKLISSELFVSFYFISNSFKKNFHVPSEDSPPALTWQLTQQIRFGTWHVECVCEVDISTLLSVGDRHQINSR